MVENTNQFCTNCGNKLSKGSGFCSRCGKRVNGEISGGSPTLVDSKTGDMSNIPTQEERNVVAEFTDASNPYAPENPIDPKRSRRAMIVGVICGVLIVAIVIIAGIIIHNNIVESEGGPSSEIIQMNPEKVAEEAESEAEEAAVGRMTPWGEVFETAMVSWSVDGNEAVINDLSNGDVVGMVCTTSNSDKEDERKRQIYVIGEAMVNESLQDVHLILYYLKDGKPLHWAAEGGQTAIQSGLLSLDDIANALKLNTVTGLESVSAANFVLSGTDASSNTASKSANTGSVNSGNGNHPSDHTDAHHDDSPFYGVWIGASQSESEAKKVSYSATSKGFAAGCVLSSNWSNLNQGAWWCVTVGYCSSESEAKALCKKAKAAGYTDAYVKYSGKHHI